MDLLFVINGSLDFIDEIVQEDAGQRSNRKPYLGLINFVDGWAVYSYLSNTSIKAIVVLDASLNDYAVPDEQFMERYLTDLYFCFVDAVSNPFFEVSDMVLYFSEDESSSTNVEETCLTSKKSAKPHLYSMFSDRILDIVHKISVK